MIEIGEGVVHESVSRFVCSNGTDHVEELCGRRQTPVVLSRRQSRSYSEGVIYNGNAWGWDILPLRDKTALNILDAMSAELRQRKFMTESGSTYYVRTASSSSAPTNRCAIFGETRYMRKKAL